MLHIKDELTDLLRKAVSKSFALDCQTVPLEHPKAEAFGDYSSSLALTLAKKLKQPPLAIAGKIAAALPTGGNLIEKVEVAAPGFINITLTKQVLLHEVARALTISDLFGHTKNLVGQKIMVEFAHPNTHKQFHIGHLRNLALGESLVRLIESQGATVIRANYQGDVGLHVAKALFGIKQKLKTDGLKLEDLEAQPLADRIAFLGMAYAAGHAAYETPGSTRAAVMRLNKAIYKKGRAVLKLWLMTRAWSLAYFDGIYQRLGAHFDRFYFESEVFANGMLIAKGALKAKILKVSQGAVVFDGAPYGLDVRVFITSRGLPTYEAKELGLARLEFSEFGVIAKCLHVVAPEQSSFFKVTFKVEELLAPTIYAGKQEHFAYGYVDLKSGKMSSRSGNVVTAVSLLEAAKEKARLLIKNGELTPAQREEIAEKVAVGAVKYSLLKYGAKTQIAFDLNESVALTGSSGPYLQYTYARARSVLRKLDGVRGLETFTPASVILNGDELSLARWLARFPEVVQDSATDLAPNLICEHLEATAQKFNVFYDKNPILKAEAATKELRFLLTAAAAQVLKNGLNLLGIATLERM